MARSAAYIRKSVVHEGSRTMSWEVQEAEVRALAAKYGDDPVILSDWGKSGRKGANHRPGYAELVRMISDGEVSTIYAYNLSRLSRSLMDYAALAALCVERKVPIRLYKEGEQNFASASGRMTATILSAVAQMEAENAQENARDVIRARRVRGDTIGRPCYGTQPGEDIALVIDAFTTAGSYHGAARLLSERGVPTRLGKPWRATTVRSLLTRYAPHVVPMGQTQRARSSPPFRFARLLTCHCGRTLTGVNQKGRPRYVCIDAFDRPDHPLPKSVSESEIIATLEAEARRLRVPAEVISGADDPAAMTALTAERDRVLDMYQANLIDAAERDRRLDPIATAMAALDIEARTVAVPQLDWNGAPAQVNRILRTMWSAVRLDPALRVRDVEWRLPEWRSADEIGGAA